MMGTLKTHPDKVIIAASLALIMLGMIFIYSSTGPFCQYQNPPKPTWYFLSRQALWALLAVGGMFLMYRLDYKVIVKFSPALVMLALLALAAVLALPGGAARRWLSVGGLTVQPSEFFKFASVALLARVAGKNAKLDMGMKRFLFPMALIFMGILLILREPDLGTAALALAVVAVTLFLCGFALRYLLMIAVLGLVAASILVFGLNYQRDRVEKYLVTLKDPFDPNASYQTRQSLVSFGSGGGLGRGLGYGGQKHLFLPARHTDFILSAAAEEGGFAIVTGIFILFGLIGWSGYKIAENGPDVEGSILAWGCMLLISLQALVNAGVALGLLPITGMTLPFVSYGGSSLVACSIAVGTIASVARRAKSPKTYFKRKRR